MEVMVDWAEVTGEMAEQVATIHQELEAMADMEVMVDLEEMVEMAAMVVKEVEVEMENMRQSTKRFSRD